MTSPGALPETFPTSQEHLDKIILSRLERQCRTHEVGMKDALAAADQRLTTARDELAEARRRVFELEGITAAYELNFIRIDTALLGCHIPDLVDELVNADLSLTEGRDQIRNRLTDLARTDPYMTQKENRR